jgi:hypothetical protein
LFTCRRFAGSLAVSALMPPTVARATGAQAGPKRPARRLYPITSRCSTDAIARPIARTCVTGWFAELPQQKDGP